MEKDYVELIIPINKDMVTEMDIQCSVGELVRCKDCKFWHESETHNGFGDCGQANGITLKASDWFCADGKKKSTI